MKNGLNLRLSCSRRYLRDAESQDILTDFLQVHDAPASFSKHSKGEIKNHLMVVFFSTSSSTPNILKKISPLLIGMNGVIDPSLTPDVRPPLYCSAIGFL